MTDIDKIKEVFHRFEFNGLVSQDIDVVLGTLSDRLLGIGIGEQGIVTSKDDVRRVLQTSQKDGQAFSHTITYRWMEVLLHSDAFASICAEVIVTPNDQNDCENILESRFNQMLSLHKEAGEWKICALHASTPEMTEENIEAYPLKIAEKTLQSLRKRIGEEVYRAEETYRQAILADTIAFYIINLTKNVFEKCQLNGDLCVKVDVGVPYEQFVNDNVAHYVAAEDRDEFSAIFSIKNIERTYESGLTELSFEYRLQRPDREPIWVVSILRLILDSQTNEKKGIMYVRDINSARLEKTALINKVSCDSMTKLFHKEAVIQRMNEALHALRTGQTAVLIMLDVDDFKAINDTYGHPVGDETLIFIAEALKASFGGRGLAGRMGGDEFCLFLSGCHTKEEVLVGLLALCDAIAALRIKGAANLTVSCSVGVAFSTPGACFHEIYAKADSALYRSKKKGKRQITFHQEED